MRILTNDSEQVIHAFNEMKIDLASLEIADQSVRDFVCSIEDYGTATRSLLQNTEKMLKAVQDGNPMVNAEFVLKNAVCVSLVVDVAFDVMARLLEAGKNEARLRIKYQDAEDKRALAMLRIKLLENGLREMINASNGASEIVKIGEKFLKP